MTKEDALKKIAEKQQYQYKENIYKLEAYIIEKICMLPYELLDKEQYKTLFTNDYEAGTFYISEREQYVNFLFDEKKQSFYEWFKKAIGGEIKQLQRNSEFSEKLRIFGEEELINVAYQILFFKDKNGKKFYETIPNQEYSDMFRRIILFLIYDDPNYEINTYLNFNRLGKKLIPVVLEKGEYNLRDRLIQSIYSGMIGMDIKDELAATSPLSRNKIIPLSGDESDEEKINLIYMVLDDVVQKGIIDIDSWLDFEEKVVNAKKKTSICWFTDDYIPTLFEMKFMELLLVVNSNLDIYIVPRFQSYSNDASWKDVEEFMQLSVFRRLKEFQNEGRFKISHYGMAAGTFNGKKLSKKCANIMPKSDYVVIAGARSYEMGQGINKTVFFTGIAICRTYSETVTGVCKEDGGIVFLQQLPGTKSFEGFRNRGQCRKFCELHNRWYPVASKTAIDYINEKEKVE